MYKLLLTFFHLTLVLGAYSQEIIWEEYFVDSTVVWPIDTTDCDGSSYSFFGIRNERIEITDMEGSPCCFNPEGSGANYNTWESKYINTSSFSSLILSYQYGSIGDFECFADSINFSCFEQDSFFGPNVGHDQMLFQVKLDTAEWQLLEYHCGNAEGVSVFELPAADSINFRVIAANKSNFETYWFDDIVLMGDRVVNTTSVPSENALWLSPNPFSDQLTIRFNLPVARSGEVFVFNTLGKEVFRKSNLHVGQNEIIFQPSLSINAPQLYFVILQIGEERIVRKVIGGG